MVFQIMPERTDRFLVVKPPADAFQKCLGLRIPQLQGSGLKRMTAGVFIDQQQKEQRHIEHDIIGGKGHHRICKILGKIFPGGFCIAGDHTNRYTKTNVGEVGSSHP